MAQEVADPSKWDAQEQLLQEHMTKLAAAHKVMDDLRALEEEEEEEEEEEGEGEGEEGEEEIVIVLGEDWDEVDPYYAASLESRAHIDKLDVLCKEMGGLEEIWRGRRWSERRFRRALKHLEEDPPSSEDCSPSMMKYNRAWLSMGLRDAISFNEMILTEEYNKPRAQLRASGGATPEQRSLLYGLKRRLTLYAFEEDMGFRVPYVRTIPFLDPCNVVHGPMRWEPDSRRRHYQVLCEMGSGAIPAEHLVVEDPPLESPSPKNAVKSGQRVLTLLRAMQSGAIPVGHLVVEEDNK